MQNDSMPSINSQSLVLFEKDNGIATLTLNRPDKLNAMSAEMRHQFGHYLDIVAHDPDIHILILKACGRAFCVGADISSMPTSPLDWRDRIQMAQHHHEKLIKMNKIVIAAVNGIAAGGGASLALAADILIMDEEASLRFPFVRLGLIPDGGCSFLLQTKLGVPLALDLMLTGGEINAQDAQRLGLTRRVVPKDLLSEASRNLAIELLKLPKEAQIITKSVCRQTWGSAMDSSFSHEADAFAFATMLPGHKEALMKIANK